MGMVISILEGELPPDKVVKLEANFAEYIKALEPGIVQTSLIRNAGKCKVIILWESKEALTAMKVKGTPKAVLLFRYAGVEPTLLAYDVVNSASKGK